MSQEQETIPSSPSSGEFFEPERKQPETKTPPSALSRVWRHLNEDVRASSLAELELLILTFCIGLQGM
jgi:hypothetical protein